jgi:CBS domain-containing protein
MTPIPRELLEDAWVPADATLANAMDKLRSAHAAGVAVLDSDRRVLGIIDELTAVRGVFPSYLSELRHTAFVDDDEDALARRRGEARAEAVTKHMRRAATVDETASITHVAEVFLHCDSTAIAVVSTGRRFVGILSLDDFARHVM